MNDQPVALDDLAVTDRATRGATPASRSSTSTSSSSSRDTTRRDGSPAWPHGSGACPAYRDGLLDFPGRLDDQPDRGQAPGES